MTNPRRQTTLSFRINMRRAAALAIAFTLAAVLTPPARAQTYQVIHRFSYGDGANPPAGLSMDSAGRFYGTTFEGGTHDYGTVFRLVHSAAGWVLTPIYEFAGGGDGAHPVSRVVFGPDGSLYGTTFEGGGSGFACDSNGCGTVFNLRPPLTACKAALCPWTKTTIHAFDGNDGDQPVGDLIFDLAGNLYGTTVTGGFYRNSGVVYQLIPNNGGWTENVLYEFLNYDLHYPGAGVTFDKAGNLYGTVERSAQGGGVFQLTPSGSGWTENNLYVFQGGADGATPYAGVIFDDAGNLYGATASDGENGGGTIFELKPSNGGWAFSVLYSFVGICCGPGGPQANLFMDKAGNLYGTTYTDGAYGLGAVFKLTPGPSGWTYTSLHDFTGPEGAYPMSNVIIDANGNLYGTTAGGGRHDVCSMGCGVAWEITP